MENILNYTISRSYVVNRWLWRVWYHGQIVKEFDTKKEAMQYIMIKQRSADNGN